MRRALVAIVLLFLPALAWSQVNTLPSAPHILVRGHAQGEYVPDRFTIHLNVNVVDKSPDVARRKVEDHIATILAALKETGAMRKRTLASSLSIQPDYEYVNRERVFKGTDVRRTVQATFDSLGALQRFIARVHTDKEVQITRTSVARSDIDVIRMRLRQRAIANSKQAAAQLAKAYGVKLEGVYSVSEVAPEFAYGIRAGSWQASSGVAFRATPVPPPPPPPSPLPIVAIQGPPPALQTGTIKVEMNMYAVYLIGH